MKLTAAQQQRYASDGYLLLPQVLDADCLSELESELPSLVRQANAGCVLENDGHTVRSVYCSHLKTGRLAQLVRDRRLLTAAQQLLGDVYLYQLKVNFKRAYSGGGWSWHQDFVYWKSEDGLLSPDLVNAVVFLDDIAPDNGPIQLIAGSHVAGSIPTQVCAHAGTQREVVTGDRYTLSDEYVAQLRKGDGQVTALGKRGSVLYFHPNLIHGSTGNASSQDRRLLLITYCDVHNRPTLSRPEYLVGSDYRPLRSSASA